MLQAIQDAAKYCQVVKILGVSDQDVAGVGMIWLKKEKPNCLKWGNAVQSPIMKQSV